MKRASATRYKAGYLFPAIDKLMQPKLSSPQDASLPTSWILFVPAAMAIIYALAMRLFTKDWVTGWTALFIAVLFIGGAQLLSLGIIGEYIGRIYGEAKRRPLYLVEDARGFEHAYERAMSRNGTHQNPSEGQTRRRRDDNTRWPRRDADVQVPMYHEPAAAARIDEPIS